jgi:hypothetical protein
LGAWNPMDFTVILVTKYRKQKPNFRYFF